MSGPSLNQVVDDLLGQLSVHLPAPIPPAPAPTVGVVSVTPKSLGLGGWRGNEVRGTLPVLALKGGQLDAVVRFQLWANDITGADTAVKSLQSSLLAARDTLRSAGFLQVGPAEVSLVEQPSGIAAWRETANYRVLYEYQYEDTDGADSLIAQIPVAIDDRYREVTTVRDQFVRWDNSGVLSLELGGGDPPTVVRGLAIFAFLPIGWDGGAVTVRTSVGGVAQQWTTPTLRAFVNAFSLDPGATDLGGDPYQSGRLDFPNVTFPQPIKLVRPDDVFRVDYATLALGFNAVTYLRALT